ncbi:WD repeat protein [Entamoeba marina]
MASIKQILPPNPATNRGSPSHLGYFGNTKGSHMVYPCGNTIVIRNMEDPLDTDIYYEHTCQTTCAKYSYSGYYICSGDVQGNVRIWDTTQKEHPLKLTIKALSGAVHDISWTGDSQRIAVVGEGREKLGVVFLWDAGSSVGEITGQTKTLLSCDLKNNRPFRLITAGEDAYSCWFEGPPFKFKKSIKDIHNRFINCCRFSPDGVYCACCGSDKIVSVLDGKTGELKYTKTEHKAGVYSITWSPDSKTFITSSADKTCKLWNAEDGSILQTYNLGSTTDDQQLGSVWTSKGPITLSLGNEMNILNVDGSIVETIQGHVKPVCALQNFGEYLFSASNEGRVFRWEKATGKNCKINGKGHATRINQLLNIDQKYIATLGADDCVKFIDLEKLEYVESVATESPANYGVSLGNNTIVVCTNKAIKVISNFKVVQTIDIANGVSCVAVSADKNRLLAGVQETDIIQEYTVTGSKLTYVKDITDGVSGTTNVIVFSDDGKYLITADASRYITLRNAEDYSILHNRWVPHNSRVNKAAFNADSTLIATAGADSYSYILNVETKAVTPLGRLHPTGVNDVFFNDDGSVYTCGADCAIKVVSL